MPGHLPGAGQRRDRRPEQGHRLDQIGRGRVSATARCPFSQPVGQARLVARPQDRLRRKRDRTRPGRDGGIEVAAPAVPVVAPQQRVPEGVPSDRCHDRPRWRGPQRASGGGDRGPQVRLVGLVGVALQQADCRAVEIAGAGRVARRQLRDGLLPRLDRRGQPAQVAGAQVLLPLGQSPDVDQTRARSVVPELT